MKTRMLFFLMLLVVITQSSSCWEYATIDAEGCVGYGCKLAIDKNGGAHFVYADVTNRVLKYATGDIIETVPGSDDDHMGWVPQIAVDNFGVVHIVFDIWKGNYSLPSYCRYAKRADGEWTVETIGEADTKMDHPKIVVDSEGNPHILHLEKIEELTNELTYSRCIYGDWLSEAITLQESTIKPRCILMAIDKNDDIHLVYKKSASLYYEAWSSGGEPEAIDEGHRFTGLFIADDSCIHVCYLKENNYAKPCAKLMYAKRGIDGSWSSEEIASGFYEEGGGSSVHSLEKEVLYVSEDKVYVVYQSPLDCHLKCYSRALGGGSWSRNTIDASNHVGDFISVKGTSFGELHIAYNDMNNWDLRYCYGLPEGNGGGGGPPPPPWEEEEEEEEEEILRGNEGKTIGMWGPGRDISSGQCFIATAVFGSPFSREVMILSEFRDDYLLGNPVGRGLVNAYYKTSPSAAGLIKKSAPLRWLVRAELKVIAGIINILNH